MGVLEAVNERYSNAAKKYESMPCCPGQSYDKRLLQAIPAEVIERDYGCGDPSPYVRKGDIVLDLGSGGGKLCFIASQITGASGRVIGVDMNDEMLALARKAAPEVAKKLGYANVEFRKGRIEDLALDLDAVDRYLEMDPIKNWADLDLFDEMTSNLRASAPLLADASVDVVVSNCVLNLVSPAQKRKLFSEIHRVLKPGGRAVISDVVCDEVIPAHLQADKNLWSGCASGAMLEDEFLEAFAQAGLYGVTVVDRNSQPYVEIEGIEFRTMTITAYKGKEGPCWEHNQAVIYKGPFKRVEDDDGHVMERGKRVAVCAKTFAILDREPYKGLFERVEPNVAVDPAGAAPFACEGTRLRDPRETKGLPARADSGDDSCRPGCC